jgi:hypothetical protein
VHEREATLDPRPVMATLAGSLVEQVGYAEAAALIRRYEWLKTMPALTTACYGPKAPDGQLPVRSASAPVPATLSADLCGPEWRGRAIALMRGACVCIGRTRTPQAS